ncbi:hypothetical protein HID58_056445, partial [Brassica napus]
MVSGDKGRVDLHYYDGIGSEIGERKQKEGFSIKDVLDLRRHFRKFGKSRWSRQIESEKSLSFLQSSFNDSILMVRFSLKRNRKIFSLSIYLCFSWGFYCQYVGFCFIASCCLKAGWNKTGLLGVCFYCEMVYLGKNFLWFGDQWGKLCVAGSHKLTGLYGFFGNTLLSVLFTTHAAIGLIKPNAVKHVGIVCVLWSRDGTRKTMWPMSSWVDEVLKNFLNFMVLLRIMGHQGHTVEGDLRWSGHRTLSEYAGEQVTLCVSYSQTLLMFGTCLHVGEGDITVSKTLGFDGVG